MNLLQAVAMQRKAYDADPCSDALIFLRRRNGTDIDAVTLVAPHCSEVVIYLEAGTDKFHGFDYTNQECGYEFIVA